MPVERTPQGSTPVELDLEVPLLLNSASKDWRQAQVHARATRSERLAKSAFVLPAILALLFLSIFPLLVSLYVSLSRFKIAKGGFELTFVGWANYQKLLFGLEQTHFLGQFAPSSPLSWAIFGGVVVALAIFLARYLLSSAVSIGGLLGRIALVTGLGALAWMLVHTLGEGGRLGTLSVTLLFVFVGIFFQYIVGLGLALLTVQQLAGRRFFRVVFLLPMMITPVGIAYMFRMITDTGKGPFTPLWQAFGLANFSWVNNPWGARTAILIADIWQWTPFVFIVLVAALEGQAAEPF